MAVMLSADVLARIRAHGRETYPHECCGALIGQADAVTEALPLPNTTEEGPRRRFLVRPQDYRLAEARASAVGGILVGFYHSHPDHPAEPSQYDLDHAWPSFSYVIVAVRKGEPEQVRSFRLRDDRTQFDEETLTALVSSRVETPAGSVEGGASASADALADRSFGEVG